jgi:hypothetical protein
MTNVTPTPDIPIYMYRDGPNHGPVYLTGCGPDGVPRVQAWCAACVWEAPERTGDPHALDLADDDAIQHLHATVSSCSACETCRPDGALR